MDLFINVRLMHHIADHATRAAMLGEIARVTRGTVVTTYWTTPCWRYLRRRIRGKSIRGFPMTPTEFAELCTSADLTVRRVIPVRRWYEEQVLVVCDRAGTTGP